MRSILTILTPLLMVLGACATDDAMPGPDSTESLRTTYEDVVIESHFVDRGIAGSVFRGDEELAHFDYDAAANAATFSVFARNLTEPVSFDDVTEALTLAGANLAMAQLWEVYPDHEPKSGLCGVELCCWAHGDHADCGWCWCCD